MIGVTISRCLSHFRGSLIVRAVKAQTHTHAALSVDVQTHSLVQGHTSVWSVWSEQLCETEKRLPN